MSETFGMYAVEVANLNDVGYIAEHHGKTFADIESAFAFGRSLKHVLAFNVIDHDGNVVKSWHEPKAQVAMAAFIKPQQIEEA